MTMTSTSGSRSSSASAAHTSVTALGPWTATSRTSKSAEGRRARAFFSTSRIASEARPVMSPIR